MYAPADLERLEQIVALKFLGLRLKQIKRVVDRDRRALPDVLRAQRRALEEKRRRLDQAIGVIAHAEQAIQPGRPAEAALIRRIIEVIDMQDNRTDMKQYYSDEAWAELERRRREMTPDEHRAAEEGTEKWQALFKDVEAALGGGPARPAAPAAAGRLNPHVNELTRAQPYGTLGVARGWNQ